MSKKSKKLARHHVRRKHKDAGRNIDELNKSREPDLDIELGAASMQRAKDLLVEAEKAGVEVITKTYGREGSKGDITFHPPDPATGYPYLTNPVQDTHSLGIKPHPHGQEIAKSLLNIASKPRVIGLDEKVDISSGKERFVVLPKDDDRPLIDLLHEATFTNPPGMNAIKDLYGLRMLLRKAHCFTLNDATSAMVADFSLATAQDLEASRQMAIPPFDVTWIELDNHARLNRMKVLNAPLEKDDPANPPAKRIGWLIHPTNDMGGWFATYVTSIDIGVWMAPMSYYWHAASPNLEKRTPFTTTRKTIEWLTFGTAGNVADYDAYIITSNLHYRLEDYDRTDLTDTMAEMAGELRHIWGFLIALGAGHLGASAQYTPQAKPTTAPPIMKNGKPLLPLEHKVLHLHLNKKPPAKIIAQSITHHHNRKHDVRAHWRQLKSGKRVPVKSHTRGDERLGRIEKTYRVER